MYIDPASITSAEKLIAFLNLKSEKPYRGLNVAGFLGNLWRACEQIWDHNKMPQFTEHDLHHSLRIIGYFMDLDSLYSWKDYEKLLFASAAMLHDIGMQFEDWGKNIVTISESGFPEKMPLPEDIREMHEELVLKLVAFQGTPAGQKLNFPPMFCTYQADDDRYTISQAALIAAAHRKDKYLQVIKDSHSPKEFRQKLLAGTLRICDEIDGNYHRVPNPDRIEMIDPLSKLHWLSCYFVQTVEIDVETHSLRPNLANLEIVWRVPEGSTQKEQELIKNFIEKVRLQKIKQEIRTVQTFYGDEAEANWSQKQIVARFSAKPPLNFATSIKINWKELIEDRLRKDTPDRGEQKPIEDKKKRPPKIAQLTKASHNHHDVHLQSDLLSWYEDHKKIGHFELLNGEHTDVYLNCRELAGEQGLVLRMAKNIQGYYLDSGAKIAKILALGTSAIPIGTNLAFLLKAGLTFTFYRGTAAQNNPNNDYGSFEVKPIMNDGETVLILDDIVSSGLVVENLLASGTLSLENRQIFHHALFRLGKQTYSPKTQLGEPRAIVTIPNIMYAPDADSCVLCKEGMIALQYESEMF
ncbi:MAG: hypothetical protein KIT70_08430 [Anaerolineales bacterium]|nr:MAG: hypothetical protein KIT70_08430 [Anaerolineales bacterium]